MHFLVLKSATPNSNYGQSKKESQNSKKNPYGAWAIYSLWYLKIDPSQNQDLSKSLKHPYKELLNEWFRFEIRRS